MDDAQERLLELDALTEGLIDSFQRIFNCDWVSLNEVGAQVGDVIAVVKPPAPDHLYAAFGQYATQNPVLGRYLETLDGRAYRISDVVTTEEFHALELYKHVYAELGVEYQLAFTLPGSRERVLAVALSRKHKDFTDAERDEINAARPFLIQAWRNAIEHTALRDQLAANSNSSLPIPIVVRELVERGLTERQAEVVMAVARGSSNRDAARALGISDRTVQKHLERSYRELGVAGRSQAADLVWSLISEYSSGTKPGRRGLEGHAPAPSPS